MKRFLLFILPIIITISVGCSSKNTPTQASALYTGYTSQCKLSEYDTGYSSCSSSCSATISAFVQYFNSGSGGAVTNALVVLTSPTGPVTLAYTSSAPSWPYNGSCAYQAGFVYTLNIYSSFGNLSASVTAPGGISYASSGSGPVTWTASWTYPVQNTTISANDGIGDSDSTPLAGHLNSPYVIPNSFFPQHGTYTIQVDCENYKNLSMENSFMIDDYLSQSVTE